MDIRDAQTQATTAALAAPDRTVPALVRAQLLTVVMLQLVAGYVDAVAFVVLAGVFVSFMSGNSTQTGLYLGEWRLLAFAKVGLAPVGYVLGAMTGAWLMRRRHGLRLVLLLQLGLLLAFGVVSDTVLPNAGPSGSRWPVLVVAGTLAMGLQTAAIQRVGTNTVGIGYVTGTLATLGHSLASWVDGRAPGAGKDAGVLVVAWLSFVVGATISGWLSATWGVTLLVPLLLLVTLLLRDLYHPQPAPPQAPAERAIAGSDDGERQ